MSIVFTDTAVLGSGTRWSALPDLDGAIYAGWLLGTAYHGAGGFDGTPLTDLSGNGRDLVLHGAGPGAKSMACSPAAWCETPFGLDALYARGEATIVTVAASSPAGGFVEAGVLDVTSGTGRGLAAVAAGDGVPLIGYNYPGGVQVNVNSAVARDAAIYEMHAVAGGRDGLLGYRRRAGMAAAERGVSAGAVTIASTQHLRIGRSIDDGPFAGSGNVAMVIVATRALGIADLDALYAEIKALLGHFAVAI